MEKSVEDQIDELYSNKERALERLEQEQRKLRKEEKDLEEGQQWFGKIHRDAMRLLEDMREQWRGNDMFLKKMDREEEDICARYTQQCKKIEDRKDEIMERKRELYRWEEDYEADYVKNKKQIEDEEAVRKHGPTN